MAQVKVYGVREYLNPIKSKLSAVIHSCIVEALAFPPGKKSASFLSVRC